jgi:hypothetical protein
VVTWLVLGVLAACLNCGYVAALGGSLLQAVKAPIRMPVSNSFFIQAPWLEWDRKPEVDGF